MEERLFEQYFRVKFGLRPAASDECSWKIAYQQNCIKERRKPLDVLKQSMGTKIHKLSKFPQCQPLVEALDLLFRVSDQTPGQKNPVKITLEKHTMFPDSVCFSGAPVSSLSTKNLVLVVETRSRALCSPSTVIVKSPVSTWTHLCTDPAVELWSAGGGGLVIATWREQAASPGPASLSPVSFPPLVKSSKPKVSSHFFQGASLMNEWMAVFSCLVLATSVLYANLSRGVQGDVAFIVCTISHMDLLRVSVSHISISSQ